MNDIATDKRDAILNALKTESMRTMDEICQASCYSKPVVSKLLRELVEAGEANELAMRLKDRGRPTKHYSRRKANSERFYDLHVWSMHIRPRIERKMRIAASTTFLELHFILQAAFGFRDAHMFEFRFRLAADRKNDRVIDEEMLRTVKIDQIPALENKFMYVYDFGDDWQFMIDIVGIGSAEPDTALPDLIAGALAGPPEDCGGPYGYEALLERIANGRKKRDGEDGSYYDSLVSEFESERFDLEKTRDAVRQALVGMEKNLETSRTRFRPDRMFATFW